MENEVSLTAEDIKIIDTLSAEKSCLETTLEIALRYHTNALESLNKKERDWWRMAHVKYDLDGLKTYKVVNDLKGPRIVEHEREGKKDGK